MKIHVGTSGFSYKEWKGKFYPDDLPAAKMLRYYAERFDTVEINNTFYRMPAAKSLESWRNEVEGSPFLFALKAPQQITHKQRLVGSEENVRYLFEVAQALGDRLGPVLFQLPPFARKDVDKLRTFVHLLPEGKRCAFEFRHASWFDSEVFEVLREKGVALCAAETEETTEPDSLMQPTSSFGYLRLRRLDYSDEQLSAWRDRIAAQKWEECFVFFKHEDEARGPEFAVRFGEMVGG
jgi:uncharacterized protein YecE (DUF72 family)